MERRDLCRRRNQASGADASAGLAIGTGLVAALYLVLNVVFIYAMPLET